MQATIDRPTSVTRLRLGDAVRAVDGSAGVVGDIVVDPVRRTVTHLVVEPHLRHQQARLVPIERCTASGTCIHLDLTRAEVRGLPRVAFSDFVSPERGLELGPEWDVGTETIVALPYYGPEFGRVVFDGVVDVTYDRIPKGECEIRRTSTVHAADGTTIGRVEGFAVERDQIAAVIVRRGWRGFGEIVAVPVGAVSHVRNDAVDLMIDRSEMAALPRARRFEHLFDADQPGEVAPLSPLGIVLRQVLRLVRGPRRLLEPSRWISRRHDETRRSGPRES